jgi:hypothetical protein
MPWKPMMGFGISLAIIYALKFAGIIKNTQLL